MVCVCVCVCLLCMLSNDCAIVQCVCVCTCWSSCLCTCPSSIVCECLCVCLCVQWYACVCLCTCPSSMVCECLLHHNGKLIAAVTTITPPVTLMQIDHNDDAGNGDDDHGDISTMRCSKLEIGLPASSSGSPTHLGSQSGKQAASRSLDPDSCHFMPLFSWTMVVIIITTKLSSSPTCHDDRRGSI